MVEFSVALHVAKKKFEYLYQTSAKMSLWSKHIFYDRVFYYV